MGTRVNVDKIKLNHDTHHNIDSGLYGKMPSNERKEGLWIDQIIFLTYTQIIKCIQIWDQKSPKIFLTFLKPEQKYFIGKAK